MTGFLVLLRTMLRHYFSLSVMREVYIKRKQDLWKPALVLLAIVAGVLPTLYAYVRFLQTAYAAAGQLQQPGLVIVLGLVSAQLVILFFGLSYLMSVFYFSADLEHLVPLPIKPETILAAKFSIVLISEYITALPMAVPPIVIYGLGQGVGLLYWLRAAFVVILLPLLPLALASILVVGIMRFTGLARNRERFTVILGLVTLALVLVVQWHLGRLGSDQLDPTEMLIQLMSTPNSLLNLLGRRFPPALWGSLALSSQGSVAWRYLLFYLGSTLASLALLWGLARKFFFDSLLHGSPVKRHHRHPSASLATDLGVRSPLAALIHREWHILVRNPIFAMNAGANVLLPPILVALPILGGGEQFLDLRAALANPRLALWGSLVVAAFFAVSAPMSAIPATAISREGRLFWISRSMPVAPRRQLLAKLAFSVALLSASSLLLVLVLVALLRLPLDFLFTGCMLGVLGLLGTSAISLAIDTLWPRLDWDNPQQAMKGNFNVVITLVIVGALGYGLVRLVIRWVGQGWSDQAVVWATTAVLAVLSVLSIRLLLYVGPAVYTQYRRYEPRSGRRLTARSVITIALVLVGVLFLGRELLTMTTLDYTFGPEDIRFGSVRIAYDEITEVQYLERIPSLSNRVGTSIGVYKAGTFTVAGIGRGKVFATDSTKPALLLRTQTTFYVITPDDARQRFLELQSDLE